MKLEFKDVYTYSNLLSLFRLFMAIPIWFLFNSYFGNPSVKYYLAALCLFAAFTDLMDGYLARKFDQVTEFGKIIDPLADKVFIAALVLRLYVDGMVDPLTFWVIVGRDLLILIAGILLASKMPKVLPSNYFGKFTVIVISFFLLATLLGLEKNSSVYTIWSIAVMALSGASLFVYGKRGYESMKSEDHGTV